MHWNRPKTIAVVAAAAVLVGGVATGRHLLARSTAASTAATAVRSAPTSPATSPQPAGLAPQHASSGATGFGTAGTPAAAPTATNGSEKASTTSGADSRLPDVPVSAVTPLVVHTATIAMRVGKGKLDSVLQTLTVLAGADGGYVDSSSISGGTTQRSPVAATITFRVLDSNFPDAIAKVAGLGTVDDQKINGKDVTVQVAQNAASITVLQDEVSLLERKLAEATDIGTFLQIQNQLVPVQQQLQQLQAAEAVLENSAQLARVTVSLTAPGAPVAPVPTPRPRANAATTAWRYLRHNSLAVLDGLAVGVGWALPVLVLLALVGSIALWVIRRRRDVAAAA
ncbi:MAG TPA: DUF4349 domain-containing protein [Acidimicrobiales bacterium]|nr:DUF4349 domain-containing protein [Acidimicrobiales bacterium]